MTSNAMPPADDDACWRRPTGAEGDQIGPPPAARRPEPAPYGGPPRTDPPPPGWRPPLVVEPAAPRRMPQQDHAAVDHQEQTAATVTKGVGLIAGAVILVLLLVLCGRWLF